MVQTYYATLFFTCPFNTTKQSCFFNIKFTEEPRSTESARTNARGRPPAVRPRRPRDFVQYTNSHTTTACFAFVKCKFTRHISLGLHPIHVSHSNWNCTLVRLCCDHNTSVAMRVESSLFLFSFWFSTLCDWRRSLNQSEENQDQLSLKPRLNVLTSLYNIYWFNKFRTCSISCWIQRWHTTSVVYRCWNV